MKALKPLSSSTMIGAAASSFIANLKVMWLLGDSLPGKFVYHANQWIFACGNMIPGVCRTYASRLDFCPFSLLLRCQNTHVAQLRSVFVALHQGKIIKNRLEVLKSDRLPGIRYSGKSSSLCRSTTKITTISLFQEELCPGNLTKSYCIWTVIGDKCIINH